LTAAAAEDNPPRYGGLVRAVHAGLAVLPEADHSALRDGGVQAVLKRATALRRVLALRRPGEDAAVARQAVRYCPRSAPNLSRPHRPHAPRALIVDDEPDIRELLSITLGRMNIDVTAAGDYRSAVKQLGAERYDLVLTDMRLPDGDGLGLVEWIQDHRPGLPVAVITAHGNVEAAVRALKLGAFDFISKPLDLTALRKLITATLKLGESIEETSRRPMLRLLGDSQPMQQLRLMVAKVARSQAPVHISGDSGTGKELVARLIHDSGPRSDGPFVPVNCGAIPSELMESELFGHKKGSFTGAVTDKEGLIRSAEGGTLFLDEVADLPLHMQVKLLRVIQEKSVRPVGETREVPVDVRILSATHRKLDEMVKAGRLRGPVLPDQRHRTACRRCGSSWTAYRSWTSGRCRSRSACEAGMSDEALEKLLSYAYRK
jgi:two-component system response regulator PilR (NtrC family)